MTVFWRYWLLQVPGWGVLAGLLWGARHWFSAPLWLITLVAAGWLVKDIVFYPILRPHYRFLDRDIHERYLGQEAVAEETLDPRGYVKLQGGELWRAEVSPPGAPVARGATVVVESVDGLTLKVRR